jgi:hypothetical protein
MKRVRQFHLYFGVFFAPAIIFLALSGALQTFRLQQASGWDGVPPPAWMAWMGSVHIDQAVPAAEAHQPEAKPAGPPAPKSEADVKKAEAKAARAKAALPVKIFTLTVGIALILSTLLGLAIALNSRATRRTALIMLVAGSAIPLALLLA